MVPGVEQLPRWRNSAFRAALEKMSHNPENIEAVMQTGEAFGRGLFTQNMREKHEQWTVEDWLKEAEETVLAPLNTEFSFSKRSPDAATLFIDRDPLSQKVKEHQVASLFMYGVMRGLFQSAFPDGELLLSKPLGGDSSEFIAKAHASLNDHAERERVKHLFTVMKKTHDP
ncbi:MAG TPA: hypothetical protein VMT57_08525 [Candidatus Thermoplasmatota archaeon]|nr:hypothetical protein [Candidatus Thermoplasmatota archaeon]